MSNNFFLSVILIFTTFWVHSYYAFREHFDGKQVYIDRIHHLEKEVATEKLNTLLSEHQYLEFKQGVAEVLPELVKEKGEGEKGYPIRNLASVVLPANKSKIQEQIGNVLFETGRRHFRNKEYDKSNEIFNKFVTKYAYSVKIIEAYFFLAEGYYQQREFDQAIQITDKLINLFPESELTGFALLRVGKIYELQERNEEAIEIYKTVLKSFPQRELASQAKDSLRDADL